MVKLGNFTRSREGAKKVRTTFSLFHFAPSRETFESLQKNANFKNYAETTLYVLRAVASLPLLLAYGADFGRFVRRPTNSGAERFMSNALKLKFFRK